MKIKAMLVMGLVAGLLSVGATAFAASSVSGDVVDYDFRSGQAVVKGNVQITHDKGTASCREAEYNTKTGEGKLTGNVVADQEDAHLTCSTLVIKKKGNYLSAIGDAVLKKADKTLRAAQVNYDSDAQYAETIGDWAQMTMDDGSSLDAAEMKYNMASGVANAEGNVRLISPPRNLTARSDRAIYNTNEEEGTIYLIGNATATQDGNTVSGDQLVVRGAGGKVAAADGNVKMIIVPQQQNNDENSETLICDVVGDENIPEEVYKFYNWPGEPAEVGVTQLEEVQMA
ncbi:MAG: organic solvent tolerance protein OstA [Acidaminococcus sp.]|nr:organic solvent tolerance protein OstA [Acidaminococcus sp.]MCI2099863.1 organic solvent tolerance protein OstA [Acidaminococcus sp.]MCI2114094.1 organic solvent tolerance protein OstA [Acidaminococcus sp.]MCI2116034.1 organic solvent tolerance protein OstA [Acidaminococcus sp.]